MSFSTISNSVISPERADSALEGDRLFALQVAQLKHDELYHKDIVRLSVHDRMKHMALHMAKYAGRFCDSARMNDVSSPQDLVDAFIISLASANTLNLHLGHALAEGEREKEPFQAGNPSDFAFVFTSITGRLCKACESLDHVEAYPYREQMSATVTSLAGVIISEADTRQINLPVEIGQRLASVKDRSIFHQHYTTG